MLIIWAVEKSDCKQGGKCVYLLIVDIICIYCLLYNKRCK